VNLRIGAPRSLRARLLWLVAAALLPAALLAAAGLAALEREQRDRALQGLQQRARAIASAVDAELVASVAALEVLALSRSLDAGELGVFHREAKAAADSRGSWDSVLLTDPTGRWLLSTRVAPGGKLPGRGMVVERESFDPVVARRRPAIGNIAKGPGGRYLFPVRVPVLRAGELRYVLNALVTPSAMLRILERQKVHAQSVSAVFDSRLNIVARTRGHEELVGVSVAASLEGLAGDAAEGKGVARTHEGEPVYAAFSRAGTSAWGVALGVPLEVLDAPLRRSYVLAAAGVLLSLAGGGLAAWWLARRISGPMAALREAARAAGRGEAPVPERSGLREVDDVAQALADAVGELRQLHATLEARVAERTQELARANAELAASNEQLESFSYTVSHDLRAPLRAVDGYAALLQGEVQGLSEEAQRMLQTVRANAQRMGQLIDALLNLSRMARVPLVRRTVAMAALARECAAEARGASTAEIEIGELPACDADPQLARQVLANLLGNAFKYSARAARPRVQVGATVAGGETVYYVRDNGAGFDMQHAAKLFGVFQRLHSSDEFEGTGVGLAVVQRIVSRHGGRVWADAAPGAGATFYFTLEPPRPGTDGR
jgi:signal transduction histidine kinase